MPGSASIVIISAHRMFGDSIAEALRQAYDVRHIEDIERWLTNPDTNVDAIIVIAPLTEFGAIRSRIRSAWQISDDPLLLCLDEDDPHSYVSHVHGHHVERQRLDLADVLDIVTEQHSGI